MDGLGDWQLPHDAHQVVIVTASDLHTVTNWNGKPGFCLSGARKWFAQNGLDFRAFIRDGIDADRLIQTGDASALRLVAHVRDREAAGG